LKRMAYVIRIDWVGGAGSKEKSEHDGRFLSRFNPDAHRGMGQVWTVSGPREARQFDSGAQAVEFYKQTSKVKPVREDGEPNRPLTAFTVSIYDWGFDGS
jgi:hypothetical protein